MPNLISLIPTAEASHWLLQKTAEWRAVFGLDFSALTYIVGTTGQHCSMTSVNGRRDHDDQQSFRRTYRHVNIVITGKKSERILNSSRWLQSNT